MKKNIIAPLASLKTLMQIILTTAGAERSLLKRSMLFAVLTAVLRSAAFVCFIPLFLAVGAEKTHTAWLWAGVITLLALLTAISEWFSRDYDYCGGAARAGDALRRKIGQHLRHIPLQILYHERTGKLDAAVAGDIDDVINYTMTISIMLIQAILTPLLVGVGVLFFNFPLGALLIILFPAVLPIYFLVRPLLQQQKQLHADALAHLNAEAIEYTQGLAALKAAGAVGQKFSRFADAIRAVENVQLDEMKKLTIPNLLVVSSVELGILLIVIIGLALTHFAALSPLILAGIVVAIIRFAEPLSVFLNLMSVIEMVHNGYLRVQQLLNIAPLATNPPAQVPTNFVINLQNLTFTYDQQNTPALQNINLNIPANALTALVGPSGCGKTTLIRMLMRYADPNSGRVTIGGIDIKNIDPETLNQLIAVVFQDVYLFDDTIFANIALGRADASEADIIQAAKDAQCHDFITKLPQGYQTRVGDIGNNLSGGEKQRISIARALLKNAPIVILDEPTAALDTFSELAVQKAINALVRDKTVIVIAHRLTTIVAAQQIIVLNQGEIIEQGTHAELLQQEGKYAHLWQLQQQN